jgi:IclR family transcriptional regulator, pca regulon regulatory protein
MPRPRTQTQRFDSDGERWPSVPIFTEPCYSQSLERGLAILACFTPERPVWGIAELADELGMSRSTTHRYALTLTELGYLKRAAQRRYQLSLGVTRLGLEAMSGTGLREHARLYLEELGKRTGFTVAVGVLDGPEVLLVDRLRGRRRGQHQIDLDQAPGGRLPAHCTAVGKLLLAHLPEHEQQTVIAEMKLTKRTPSTITRKNALRAELRDIRGQSLAAAEEEFAPGLYSIAVPVRSASRETVAALGMDAHRSMIPMGELVDALGPHLVATADRVSARLGYRRADERAEGHFAPKGL